MKQLLNTFTFLFFILILSSCSKEKIDRTIYLPNDATVVVKFNAKGYLKDTFDDYLIGGKEIYKEVAAGVIGVLSAPETIGLESFADHYLFVQNLENKEHNFGLVLALNSGEKLTKYLKSIPVPVEEVSGVSLAMLNDSTNIAWDDKTAVLQICTKTLLFDQNNTISLFNQSSWEIDDTAEQTRAVHAFKNSDAHFSVWSSNSDNIAVMYQYLNSDALENLMNLITPKNSPSVIEVEIKQHNIRVKQKSYLDEKQTTLMSSLKKKNSFSDPLVFIPKSNPETWVSASLSQDKMLQMITESTQLNSFFDESLSSLLSLEDVIEYLNGDIFFSYTGSVTQEKMVFESAFNQQTGEYESGEINKLVEEKFYTLALGLKDAESFEKKIEPLSLFLTLRNSVYNFKETYFFQIKNEILYIATSGKGEALFNGGSGALKSDHLSLAKKHPIFVFVNINDTIDDSLKGIKELSIKVLNEVEGCNVNELNISFKDENNAVIDFTSYIVQLIGKI